MSGDDLAFEIHYHEFTSVGQHEHPYPGEVDTIRRQAFPTHDTILVHPDGKYLVVAIRRGKAVGYALVDNPRRRDPDKPAYAYLDELAVDEAEQGRGLGEALLREVGRLVQREMSCCDGILTRLLHDGHLEDRVRWFGEFGFVPHERGWLATAQRVAEGRRNG